jgi:hypothetical protein
MIALDRSAVGSQRLIEQQTLFPQCKKYLMSRLSRSGAALSYILFPKENFESVDVVVSRKTELHSSVVSASCSDT